VPGPRRREPSNNRLSPNSSSRGSRDSHRRERRAGHNREVAEEVGALYRRAARHTGIRRIPGRNPDRWRGFDRTKARNWNWERRLVRAAHCCQKREPDWRMRGQMPSPGCPQRVGWRRTGSGCYGILRHIGLPPMQAATTVQICGNGSFYSPVTWMLPGAIGASRAALTLQIWSSAGNQAAGSGRGYCREGKSRACVQGDEGWLAAGRASSPGRERVRRWCPASGRGEFS